MRSASRALYYGMPRPSLFLVHRHQANPTISWYRSRATGWLACENQHGSIGSDRQRMGILARTTDLVYWEYEKGDFSLRLDTEAGNSNRSCSRRLCARAPTWPTAPPRHPQRRQPRRREPRRREPQRRQFERRESQRGKPVRREPPQRALTQRAARGGSLRRRARPSVVCGEPRRPPRFTRAAAGARSSGSCPRPGRSA